MIDFNKAQYEAVRDSAWRPKNREEDLLCLGVLGMALERWEQGTKHDDDMFGLLVLYLLHDVAVVPSGKRNNVDIIKYVRMQEQRHRRMSQYVWRYARSLDEQQGIQQQPSPAFLSKLYAQLEPFVRNRFSGGVTVPSSVLSQKGKKGGDPVPIPAPTPPATSAPTPTTNLAPNTYNNSLADWCLTMKGLPKMSTPFAATVEALDQSCSQLAGNDFSGFGGFVMECDSATKEPIRNIIVFKELGGDLRVPKTCKTQSLAAPSIPVGSSILVVPDIDVSHDGRQYVYRAVMRLEEVKLVAEQSYDGSYAHRTKRAECVWSFWLMTDPCYMEVEADEGDLVTESAPQAVEAMTTQIARPKKVRSNRKATRQ